jgi:hypothetical protein
VTVIKAEREARRFSVTSEFKPSRPGTWGSSLVRIFDGSTQIGEYERNFPRYAEETFEPFEIDGAWYALYSPQYTATRVMSLPDCRDIGGEEPVSHGFCPVELYVPRYRKVAWRSRESGRTGESFVFETHTQDHWLRPDDRAYELTYGPWLSLTTGFVSGCHWGDDVTWKLEVLDLSNAARGEIHRSARFGHLELARDLSLPESLDLYRHEFEPELRVWVIRRERRAVATGEVIDPYDE